LLNTLDTIAKAGAGFRSLADPWADTTTPHGKLMLTILGGLAEFERSLILTRTGEGRARAMARGVKFGRKKKLTPHQTREAIRRREAGEKPLRDWPVVRGELPDDRPSLTAAYASFAGFGRL
jgi:DNA invertase Pin-like site-specific DNA recombinase